MTSGLFDAVAAVWHGVDGRRCRAEISLSVDGAFYVKNANGETTIAACDKVTASSRVADIPRQLTFPDGVMVTLDDNDFVDAALRRHAPPRDGWLHALESRLVWLAPLLVAAALVVWGGVRHGVPMAGDFAARQLSAETLRLMSDELYDALRRQDWLRDSALEGRETARARRAFAETIAPFADDGNDYRLAFHRDPHDSPNAFAFPGGLVVMTDKLATIAESDELAAVFAHEIAHVRERHGARMLMRSIGLLGIVAIVTGDFTGAIAAGLIAASYSREFEEEADCFAVAALEARGIAPGSLASALRRMEAEFYGEPRQEDEEGEEGGKNGAGGEGAGGGGEGGWAGAVFHLLSSHPPTDARADPNYCRAAGQG